MLFHQLGTFLLAVPNVRIEVQQSYMSGSYKDYLFSSYHNLNFHREAKHAAPPTFSSPRYYEICTL